MQLSDESNILYIYDFNKVEYINLLFWALLRVGFLQSSSFCPGSFAAHLSESLSADSMARE